MTGPSHFSDCLVIRSVDYGESDRILGLFSREHGKISAFAGGARKSQKRFGAGLDLFAAVKAELKPPRSVHGSLWRLLNVELKDQHFGIRQDLQRFATASYLAECLWKFAAEGQAQERLFAWFHRTLGELSEPSTEYDGGYSYDLELLKLCGYAPRWDSCAECAKSIDADRVFFSFERGGLTCPACRATGAGRWIETAVTRSVHEPGQLNANQKTVLKTTIDEFFTYMLGSEPKSLKFRNEVFRGRE